MKLLVKDAKKEYYMEVGFWSFLKCNLLTSMAITGMVYGVLFFFLVLIGAAGGMP